MKLLFSLFLIPLILSVGLTSASALQPEDIETECRDGQVLVFRTNSMDYICTSQSAASLWSRLGMAEIVSFSDAITEPEIPETVEPMVPEMLTERDPMLGIETIETHKGTITLDHDYLTSESAELLSDELFYLRAVQVYHLAYPAMGGAGMFYETNKVGAVPGDVVYWSDFMNSDIELLTGNTSVLYLFSYNDLNDGPIVIHVPAGNLQGHVDNIYQQQLVDFGVVGPNEGNEAFFLILPPNYDGEIPEGFDINTSSELPENLDDLDGEITDNHFVVQSDTMQVLFIARAFVNAPDKAAAEELIKSLSVYNLSEIDNPPAETFIDVSGEKLKFSHPDTDGFWEFLHEIYSKETVIRDEDKNLIGLMHSIGIVPGEPFAPNAHSKQILDKAAIIGNLMARNVAYDSPVKAPYIYYSDKNWELPFMTKNPQFEDDRGATMIEARLSYTYQAITTADAMVLQLVDKGSKYLATYRDSDDNYLKGSDYYTLHIPADVPAGNFWSLVLYDAETRSMINNGLQPLPAIRSLDSDKLIQNDDGSYDVYMGPEPPEGLEDNWVKTNEGDGWFVLFRFYSPTQEFYDKSWQLPMIEKIE